MSADAAAEAFDALRSEVALLRRALEGLSAQQPEPAPDYSRTLAKIDKATVGLHERLEALSASPTLALTPEMIAGKLRALAAEARAETHREMAGAISSVSQATNLVTKAAGVVRTREAQRRWLAYVAVASAILTLTGWIGLSGPIARSLPASWQAPERMAAAALGQDRWAAGARLMRGADAAAWARIQFGDTLVRQNRHVIDGCLKRAERLKRSVTCDVRVEG